jgi:hypothetical protein
MLSPNVQLHEIHACQFIFLSRAHGNFYQNFVSPVAFGVPSLGNLRPEQIVPNMGAGDWNFKGLQNLQT